MKTLSAIRWTFFWFGKGLIAAVLLLGILGIEISAELMVLTAVVAFVDAVIIVAYDLPAWAEVEARKHGG